MSPLTASFRRKAAHRSATALALLGLLFVGTAAAQPTGAVAPSSLPASYATQVLTPAWRAALPTRSAFGSLCALAPLACALIDRPFAFNARLDLSIRPQAPDGSTGILLPFSVSVPVLGRAEVGAGSCYAGFWGASEDSVKDSADRSLQRPSGLCPLWLAAKVLLFPWFRDAHQHPALAAEYQLEYQAGPFSGLNQLGLPGPSSKLSFAYRHPRGRLEFGAAVSVLVEHTTRAGTLMLGPHVGYRLPVGDHLWLFGQAIVQAPSWGPVIASDPPSRTLNLSPPVAGTLAVGLQQRADFGFGVGLTLLLTKSELDTRADFLFRLLSFEIGPHIKPLIPAREKHDELPQSAVAVKPHNASRLECPAGFTLKPTPQSAAQPVAPGQFPGAQSLEPACVPILPVHHSPLWGKPCYLAPFDGSESLRMGSIDSTGQYCEWDGVRLPLGAVIEPPRYVPHAQPASPPSPTLAAQTTPAGIPSESIAPAQPSISAAKAHLRAPGNTLLAASSLSKIPPSAGGPAAPSSPARDRIEHVTEVPRSILGSPFASGFVDGAKESYQHLREVYQVIKKHGPGVVIPSREVVEEWVDEVKAQCLDHLDDCVRDKAKEAAQALNDFRQKPWEDKKYTLGQWSWSAVRVTAETAAIAAIPGGKATMRAGEKAAEDAALKGAARAALKKSAEDAAEHGGEATARRAAREVAESNLEHAAAAESKGAARAAETHAAGASGMDPGREFTQEQKSLVDMAKKDKQKGGISAGDMEAYKQLNTEAGAKGFTAPGAVRGPEVHPLRSPNSKPGPGQQLHGHVGPVDHIPIK